MTFPLGDVKEEPQEDDDEEGWEEEAPEDDQIVDPEELQLILEEFVWIERVTYLSHAPT